MHRIRPQAVRSRRLLAGMTQAGLGEAAGLSGQLVWLIEAGRTNPRPPTMKAIATALGCEIADICDLDAEAVPT